MRDRRLKSAAFDRNQLAGSAPIQHIAVTGVVALVSKADEFRTEAVGCALKARLARDRRAMASFKELARQWLDMAKQAELQSSEQTTSKPSPTPVTRA